MLKLSRLLFSSVESDVFHDRIQPTLEQRETLFNAKNQIRDHLRPRIRAATTEVLGMDKMVTPRFRTQGSWSYKTCVQPAWRPPQEMDWDFGVYLPISVWEHGAPHVAAKLYFDLVEGMLQDLCDQNGWILDESKDTCIRVRVADWAHIDVPLYAAPEAQFLQVMEKGGALSANRSVLVESFQDEDLTQQQWDDMLGIVLANRTGEWKPSDPEAVARWFLDRVEEAHTEQLRRVCRYLKSWRDFHWTQGDGPTSLCIMVVVGQSFEHFPGRDDRALEHAARALATALKGDVREPSIANGEEDFNKRLKPEERQAASERASTLAHQIQTARCKPSYLAGDAVDIIRRQLGDRVPDRVELVEPDGGESAVRLVAADRVARPVVKATSAG